MQALDDPSLPTSPSGSSVRSESDPNDLNNISRQSPFTLSISQSSPSSSFVSAMQFQKPEFVQNLAVDSESSSRSSLDSHFVTKESTAERIRKFRQSRDHDHDNSSDSSSSDESEITVGTASIDGEEVISSGKGSCKQAEPLQGLLRPADAPRGRLANIRRESYSSVENEMAHERLVKVSQRVSSGWEELKLEEKPENEEVHRRTEVSGIRKTSSVSEPITIMTNAFLPHSCSPSPTRIEIHKVAQCYSPSTQQIVRANIPYSPSPSPTRSPTRHRLMRLRSQSPSPIATSVRPLKRRLNDLVYDDMKKNCPPLNRTATSPLVNEKQFPFPMAVDFTQPYNSLNMTPQIPSTSSSFGPPTLFTVGNRSFSDEKGMRDIETDSISEPSSVHPDGECEESSTIDDSQMDMSNSDVDCPDVLARPFSTESGQDDVAVGPCVFGNVGYACPKTPLSAVNDSASHIVSNSVDLGDRLLNNVLQNVPSTQGELIENLVD